MHKHGITLSFKMQALSMNTLQEMAPTTQYLVRIDNINIPDMLRGIKVLDAYNTADLMTQILAYYGFEENHRAHLQLWSGRLGELYRVRLDTMDYIPDTYEFILIRCVPNK